MTTYEGWHFLRTDRRLGYRDNRLAVVGETLTVSGPLVICKRGLHASARALDALSYAPGPIACRVQLSGTVLVGSDEHADKACATERTVLAIVDASDVLREFIRDTFIIRQPHLVTLFELAGLVAVAQGLRALAMDTAPLPDIERRCRAAAGTAAWTAAWDAAGDAAGDNLNARLESRLLAAVEDYSDE